MLPQRRKTAEEIAKLREAMGVPGAEGIATEEERQPVVEDAPPPPATAPPPTPVQPVLPAEPRAPKLVKSLRKSERVPVDVEAIARRAASDHTLPVMKHSERDLMDLRRNTAAPPEKSITFINSLAASRWIVIPMYLLTVLAFLAAWSSQALNKVTAMDFPAEWIADLFTNKAAPETGKWLMIALCGLALLMAGWIAWKKPRSRHHAGFVVIIAVLVLAFGIIYHQPLPNGP
jgi:hypothetical protein